MAKVPIDFPADFEKDVVRPIPLGRVLIGDGTCRLMFNLEGKLVLFCEERSRKHIHFSDIGDMFTLGFPK